jgi:signal transduction histidine kinase
MQIRVRLTLQFILIAAGILAISFSYVYLQFKFNLRDEYYNSLKSKALLIAEMVASNKSSDEFYLEHQELTTSPLSGTYPENISIYSPDGRRLYSFNPAPDDLGMGPIQDVLDYGVCKFDHGQFDALAISYKNQIGDDYIVIAEAIFDTVHLDNLARILILVFLIAITVVAIAGWFFARQALAPLSRIMNEVDALLPTDMSHRLETTNQKDEMSRLVVTFNKLLDRIQKVFSLQKMFLSNISHELKNPLNVIVSQVEVTLQKERSKEEYVATLSSVLSDVNDLNDVADKLMQMARINTNEASIKFDLLRIDELIWQAKEQLIKNHGEYRIDFEILSLPEDERHLLFKGNEQLLKTALVNLMDNGCKFSPDKKVKIRLSFPAREGAMIEIIDKGPGISKEELTLIFNAFYRSPRTSSIRGSGIGLSLVESILKLHQIEMKVESIQGEGTTFMLHLPQPAMSLTTDSSKP